MTINHSSSPRQRAETFQLIGAPAFAQNLDGPEWLIEDVLEKGAFATLYALPERYKSFVALHMGFAVAEGTNFMGHAVRKPGKAIYVVAEGARGMRRRVAALQKHTGRLGANLHFVVGAPQLADQKDLERLQVILSKSMGSADLLVIDTLAQTFAGQDENSAGSLGQWIRNVRQLQAALNDPAILVITHTAKKIPEHGEVSERGSSVLWAAADTRMTTDVETIDGNTYVSLRCTKQKDAERFDPIHMKVQPVELVTPQGERIFTPVLLHTQAPMPLPFDITPDADKLPDGEFTLTEAIAALGLNPESQADKGRAYRRLTALVKAGVLEQRPGRGGYIKKAAAEPLAA